MSDPSGTAGVRSVAVVGRGTALWLTGIALHRAFARTGLVVTLIEMPGIAQPATVFPCLPDIAGFHKLLGIAEADLLRHAAATFSLGQQFVGWTGEGTTFLHAYGEAGEPIADLPFLQFWLKARAGGLPVGIDDFTLAAVAARQGRITPPGAGRNLARGYHLDALGYETLLRRTAVGLGLGIVAAPNPQAQVGGGAIAAVRTGDGRTIEADLFVDATGPEARLIAAIDPAPTWSASTSPCDRMLTASAPAMTPLPLYSRIAAHDAGWLGLFPLASRTGVAMAYSSERLSDDKAARDLAALAGVRVGGDIVLGDVACRSRAKPWVGNCVAIGGAACAGDPLDAVELHREQIAITHLIALLPIDRARMIEVDIYNEEVGVHQLRIRDYQAAHYRLAKRRGPFWDTARAAPVSDDLAWKIDLFAARGKVAEYQGESFNADSWQSLLLGHGVTPRSHDPQADAVPDGAVAARLQHILGRIRGEVGAMIPHDVARAAAMGGR